MRQETPGNETVIREFHGGPDARLGPSWNRQLAAVCCYVCRIAMSLVCSARSGNTVIGDLPVLDCQNTPAPFGKRGIVRYKDK